MAKGAGFMEFTRELPGQLPVEERLRHYQEFVKSYSDEKLNEQSSRCMNCGVPFCHHGCPLGNLVPEFNEAVARKEWKEAYEILSSTNNFPEFTGRICPAPCETACVLGINQPAVAIEAIEKHVIEIAFANGLVQPRKPNLRSGKRIAIVGSGPAGLAAAAQLNNAGHWVTVFERNDAPGGLLRYGIPDFKLEKIIVDRRIQLMKEEGILFECNVNIGIDITGEELLRAFDAIVLAGGSTIPRNLEIPGRSLKGIHFAMEFLEQQNKRVVGHLTATEGINATGKNVIVIGGGDTGSDCIGTSNRQAARSVTQFELLPKPPMERTGAMPWPTYPMLLKTTSSHEEGVARQWAIVTKEFMGDEYGHLRALKTALLEWMAPAPGQPAQFREIQGSEKEVPCELALLAMGFLYPQREGLLEQLGVAIDERGNIKASENDFITSIPKVFSAGDMRRGQSLVVWAISEGRECARKVDEFLMGNSVLESKEGMFYNWQ